MYTFPYINGRLFDNHSVSYKTQDGVSRVIKQSTAPRLGALSPEDLSMCTEYYGSQELDGSPAYFFTADPSTTYWQDKCVICCTVPLLLPQHKRASCLCFMWLGFWFGVLIGWTELSLDLASFEQLQLSLHQSLTILHSTVFGAALGRICHALVGKVHMLSSATQLPDVHNGYRSLPLISQAPTTS